VIPAAAGCGAYPTFGSILLKNRFAKRSSYVVKIRPPRTAAIERYAIGHGLSAALRQRLLEAEGELEALKSGSANGAGDGPPTQ